MNNETKTNLKTFALVAGFITLIITGALYAEGRSMGAAKIKEICADMPSNKLAQGFFIMAAPRMMQVAFDGSDAIYVTKLGALHGMESGLSDCIK